MRELQRALMLQATDDQRAVFGKCMEATDRVFNLANQMVSPGTQWNYDAAVFPSQKEQLEAALADLDSAHQHFRHILAPAQEKELRKYLGKLERFRTDLSTRMAQVGRELSTSKPDARRVYSDTQKIRDVIEKWRSEHRKIANEMGISG